MHGKLCIVGCSRSGTVFIGALFRAMGLRICHEYPGLDGCVGFNFAFDRQLLVGDETNVARPGRSGLTFDHIWHQVRHPLPAISSMHTHGSGTWAMVADGLGWDPMPKTVMLRAARYWLELNRLAEGLAEMTYCVESVASGSDVFMEMCRRLEIKPLWPTVEIDRNSRLNKGRYRAATWADLEHEVGELYQPIRDLAQHYGYDGPCI